MREKVLRKHLGPHVIEEDKEEGKRLRWPCSHNFGITCSCTCALQIFGEMACSWIYIQLPLACSDYYEFYHGYCKDQRNAAVIILRYTTLRHNGLWDVIHISSFDTMWRNPCIWSSKSCQLHVDFTFQMWFWLCRFHISM